MSPSEMRGERLERLFGMLRLYCKDGAAEDALDPFRRITCVNVSTGSLDGEPLGAA